MKPYQDFKQKWGCSVKDIAEQDSVTHAAVRMRVKLYGTPFQRKKEPTIWETKYGRSLYEIATELNIHPNSVRVREQAHGNVYHAPPDALRQGQVNPRKEIDWKLKWYAPFWLHPLHPDYEECRNAGDEYRKGAESWLNQKS